jgi:hypothetical protein
MTKRVALTVGFFSLFALALSGAALAGSSKSKSKTKSTAPAALPRSTKPPSAYHIFLTEAKDNTKSEKKVVLSAKEALSKAFTRDGYVIDAPSEKTPSNADELAKWLRDKDRTGIRLEMAIDSFKESEDGGETRFDATVKAAVFTYPSGWLIMSTTGSGAAINDGLSSDIELKQAALAAAISGMVENVAAYLKKKPVPIDR